MWSNSGLSSHPILEPVLKLKSLALAALLLTNAAHADGGWSGEAAVGFLNTTGNTDARTLNAKGLLEYKEGAWAHAARAAALTAQTDKVTTDERYNAGYKVTYDFTPFDYAFGSLDYDNDRFAGIIERRTEALGYGRRLLTLPKHTLDAEIGAGATQQKLATTEAQQNAFVGLFNAKYQWLISETSSFTQTLKVEKSKDNTFINPISTLKLVIVGQLFTTLSYEVRTNTDVPAGTQKTDTLTAVNLGYSFGKKPG